VTTTGGREKLSNFVASSDSRFSRAYLLYDSRCGPCTQFMKVVKVLDFHDRLIPVSIHGGEARELVHGMISNSRLKNSFHVLEISKSGAEIYSAGDGMVRLTRYAPAGRITFFLVTHIKLLRQFVRWSYYQATRLRASSKSCNV